jgi:hypothetical protein
MVRIIKDVLKVICLTSLLKPILVLGGSPYDYELIAIPTAGDFEQMVEQIVYPAKFDYFAPGSASGSLGFEVGLGLLLNPIPTAGAKLNKLYLNNGSSTPHTQITPKLKVQKGFGPSFDVAVSLGYIQGSSLKFMGVGVQGAIFSVKGIPLEISLRGGYTKTYGIASLDQYVVNGELVASLSVLIIEPYVAVSYLTARTEAMNPNFIADTSGHYFTLGTRVKPLPFIGIDVACQYLQDQQFMYLLQASVGF